MTCDPHMHTGIDLDPRMHSGIFAFPECIPGLILIPVCIRHHSRLVVDVGGGNGGLRPRRSLLMEAAVGWSQRCRSSSLTRRQRRHCHHSHRPLPHSTITAIAAVDVVVECAAAAMVVVVDGGDSGRRRRRRRGARGEGRGARWTQARGQGQQGREGEGGRGRVGEGNG